MRMKCSWIPPAGTAGRTAGASFLALRALGDHEAASPTRRSAPGVSAKVHRIGVAHLGEVTA